MGFIRRRSPIAHGSFFCRMRGELLAAVEAMPTAETAGCRPRDAEQRQRLRREVRVAWSSQPRPSLAMVMITAREDRGMRIGVRFDCHHGTGGRGMRGADGAVRRRLFVSPSTAPGRSQGSRRGADVLVERHDVAAVPAGSAVGRWWSVFCLPAVAGGRWGRRAGRAQLSPRSLADRRGDRLRPF